MSRWAKLLYYWLPRYSQAEVDKLEAKWRWRLHQTRPVGVLYTSMSDEEHREFN